MKTTRRLLGGFGAALVLVAAGPTAAAPIAFPGGQIDGDRLNEGEIYLGQPQAAAVPPGCEIAAQYTATLRAGQFDKIGALFTPDAVLFLAGQPVRGAEAISEFYNSKIKATDPRPIVVSYAATPGVCVAQIAVSRALPDGQRQYFAAAFSQFFLAPDGRAKMMFAYGRRSPIVTGVVSGMGPAK